MEEGNRLKNICRKRFKDIQITQQINPYSSSICEEEKKNSGKKEKKTKKKKTERDQIRQILQEQSTLSHNLIMLS